MAQREKRPRRKRGTQKYAPLVAYLARSDGDEIVLTFLEIDALIGARLSLAARIETTFWTTEERAHVRALSEGGWGAHLERRRHAIVFVRRARREQGKQEG